MKLSEIDPSVARLMMCQQDLKEAKEQNKKMYEILKDIDQKYSIALMPYHRKEIDSLLKEIEK